MRSAGLRLAQILSEQTKGRCSQTAPNQFLSSREGAVEKIVIVSENSLDREKRISIRYQFQADILCAVFNTNGYFPAKMCNYSNGGLYLESETAVKPGSALYIRLSNCPNEHPAFQLSEGLRTITLGEVRWCVKLPSEGRPVYGFGIKYYQPYQ